MGNDTVWSSGLMVLLPLEAIWERTHWGDKMPLRPRTPTISASIGQATMSMDGNDDGKGGLYGKRYHMVIGAHGACLWKRSGSVLTGVTETSPVPESLHTIM